MLVSLEGRLQTLKLKGLEDGVKAELKLDSAEKISFVGVDLEKCELSVKQFKLTKDNDFMDLVLMGNDSKSNPEATGCFTKLSS